MVRARETYHPISLSLKTKSTTQIEFELDQFLISY